jgi:hypothetical protein
MAVPFDPFEFVSLSPAPGPCDRSCVSQCDEREDIAQPWARLAGSTSKVDAILMLECFTTQIAGIESKWMLAKCDQDLFHD